MKITDKQTQNPSCWVDSEFSRNVRVFEIGAKNIFEKKVHITSDIFDLRSYIKFILTSEIFYE